jgi:hypothetical protein
VWDVYYETLMARGIVSAFEATEARLEREATIRKREAEGQAATAGVPADRGHGETGGEGARE